MSTQNFTGWTSHDLFDAYSINGTAVYASTPTHSGHGSCKIVGGVGDVRMEKIGTTAVHNASLSTVTTFATFAVYFESFPASASEPIFQCRTAGGAVKSEVRITSAGKIQIYDQAIGQIGSDGATALSTGRFYVIDVKTGTGATAAYEVRIDGLSELSGTGNLRLLAAGDCCFGQTIQRNSQTYTAYFDTISIDDTAYAPARTKVARKDPTSHDTGGWGDGTVTSVDDWISGADDGDTTYVSTSAITPPNCLGYYSHESCLTAGIPVGSTIVSIKGQWRIEAALAGTNRAAVGIRSNSTDSYSSNAQVSPTPYSWRGRLLNTDHGNGGIAWTISNLDAAQTEMSNNSASTAELRCTALAIDVLYTPPASATNKYTPHAGI